jgi:plastocyanin
MTNRSKYSMLIAVAVIGLGILAATLLPTIASSQQGAVHEIRLVVRNMNFYVDGDPQPNPTLTVRAGEQVRLVLKNDDPGMRHDFVVQAWDVATRMLQDSGQQDSITFTAPATTGDQVYYCTPHSKLMRGTIRVQ